MFNAKQFFEKFNIDYIDHNTKDKHARYGWIQSLCPFCKKDKYLLGYNLGNGWFNCYHCGYHSIPNVIKKLLSCTYSEAKQYEEQFETVKVLVKLTRSQEKATHVDLPKGNLTKKHLQFLYNRGFNKPMDIVRQWNLSATNHIGDYKFRIIIPITFNNKLVSFQSRDITNKQKIPYKACPIKKEVIHHKHLLYGYDKLDKDLPVIVVEGVIDAWKMGKQSVCTFGTGFTESQVRLLSEFKKVFIVYDREETAKKQAVKLATKLLSLGTETKQIDLKQYDDPGEMPPNIAFEFKQWMFKNL